MIEGVFVQQPSLADVLGQLKIDVSKSIRVCLPGEIFSYDSGKRTAQIQPGFNRVYVDETVKPYPLLEDVPVFTLQGGGLHVQMPIKKGDECLIIFADGNIDAWLAKGGIQTPVDDRRHDICDGFAIVGLNSQMNPITTPLGTTEGGLAMNGALAKIAIDSAVGMCTLKSNTQSLGPVLQDLVSAINNLSLGVAGLTCAAPGAPVVDSTGLVAATPAALLAITAKLNALLY